MSRSPPTAEQVAGRRRPAQAEGALTDGKRGAARGTDSRDVTAAGANKAEGSTAAERGVGRPRRQLPGCGTAPAEGPSGWREPEVSSLQERPRASHIATRARDKEELWGFPFPLTTAGGSLRIPS